MVVFNDADIDKVAAATLNSVFFNSGQVCSAGSRLYVQREIYETVVQAVAKNAKQIRIGFSLDPETEMGPLISKIQQQRVNDFILSGIEAGARVVCGGLVEFEQGYFVQPTVLADCSNDMNVVQEEIFGPVLCIIPFETEEEAIELANDNIYGLAASIFTKDVSRGLRLISQINAGTVWLNTHDAVDCAMPFGGFKQSGLGKDLGPEQLESYLKTKTIWIDIAPN